MGKVAFLFAGQGAQYTGMGKSLYETSPAARAVFDLCDSIRPGTSELCFTAPKEVLTVTVNTQPCVWAVDLAAAEALQEAGIVPEAVAGFSLGELAALAFAGAYSQKDGFSLVCRRAELMDAAAHETPSGMAAVLKLAPDVVERICAGLKTVYPVNYNCPGQTAVSGPEDQLRILCQRVREAGGRATVLAVSGGFHSPFMARAAQGFRPLLDEVPVVSPRLPVYANRTAEPYDLDGLRETLTAQIDHPVLWEQTVRAMGAAGFDTFIEVGPGHTLTGLVKRTLPEAALYSCDSAEQLGQITSEVPHGR